MLQSEKWLRFEDEIRDDLIDKLCYDQVNVWYLMRREVFALTYETRRFAKIRYNAVFMRMSFFVYRFSIMVLCKLLMQTQKLPSNKKKVLITTRARDWGKVRDLKTGMVKDGEKLYDSVTTELTRRGYKVVLAYEFPEWFYQCVFGIKKLFPRIMNHSLVSMRYWSIRTWSKAYIWSKHFTEIWKQWGNKSMSCQMLEAMKFTVCVYSQIMIEDVEMSKKMLEEVKPDLVMSWAWGGFRLAINLVAKTKNIPVMCFDYATVDEWKYLVTADSEDLPDKFCVALEQKYEFLRSKGLTKEQVVWTGAPYTDIVKKAGKLYNREKFCKRLGINPLKKIVVILSGHTPHRNNLVKRSFNALKRQNVEILIKPHPDDTVRKFKKIVGSKAIVMSPDSDLYEILYLSDLTVGYYSTTITEGLMLGTPAVTVNFDNEDLAPYLKEPTLRVRVSELQDAIKKALQDDETQKLLHGKVSRYITSSRFDGRATERVADVIEKMIKND